MEDCVTQGIRRILFFWRPTHIIDDDDDDEDGVDVDDEDYNDQGEDRVVENDKLSGYIGLFFWIE